MSNYKLTDILNRKSKTKRIKIVDIGMVDNFSYIVLENGQKIVTNGKDFYDVSPYNQLFNIFTMKDKLCAAMEKDTSLYVIDLKTMEILFKDDKAYHITKQDDRTLHVIKKIGAGNNSIYDIETKSYLKTPKDYEFERSLGNNLYVFCQKHHSDVSFYEDKRCVINADGKIILKDVDGWIDLYNKHLIIKRKNDLSIVKINEDFSLNTTTIKQNEKIIAKPTFYNGFLIIMEKGVIKMYTPDFFLKTEIHSDDLTEVIDYEIIANILKIYLPYTMDGEKINKHLFINLTTKKSISHLRIEGYPYWMPTTYIGRDDIHSKKTDYHFYNADFDKVIKIKADSYESVDNNKECMFIIRTMDDDDEHKLLLNMENGNIKDIDYDYVHFHSFLPYGYGVNFSDNKMDFFDENLNVIISNFDYQKFNLNFQWTDFDYFIVNDYLCICKHFVTDFGESRWRTILQKANGELVLDSFDHKCYPLGNFIQIVENKDSNFLNTLTGDIGSLEVVAVVDENEKIDFKNQNNSNAILAINSNEQLLITENLNNQKTKIKK